MIDKYNLNPSNNANFKVEEFNSYSHPNFDSTTNFCKQKY